MSKIGSQSLRFSPKGLTSRSDLDTGFPRNHGKKEENREPATGSRFSSFGKSTTILIEYARFCRVDNPAYTSDNLESCHFNLNCCKETFQNALLYNKELL